jgi:hypothetical protein
VFKSEIVIFVMNVAGFYIKRPSAKPTSLANDNPVRIAIWYVDIGRNSKRAILCVDKGIFHQTDHTRINGDCRLDTRLKRSNLGAICLGIKRCCEDVAIMPPTREAAT